MYSVNSPFSHLETTFQLCPYKAPTGQHDLHLKSQRQRVQVAHQMSFQPYIERLDYQFLIGPDFNIIAV